MAGRTWEKRPSRSPTMSLSLRSAPRRYLGMAACLMLLHLCSFFTHKFPTTLSAVAREIPSGLSSSTMYKLHAEISRDKGNSVFSPFNIYGCMVLGYLASNDVTYYEMEGSYFENRKPEEAVAQLKLPTFPNPEETTLTTAIAAWVGDDVKGSSEYNQILQKNFGSLNPLQVVPFSSSPEKVTQRINNWVSQHTSKQIKEIVKPGSIDKYTTAVLTSALYFKGLWQKKFKAVKKGLEFNLESGEKLSDIKFMKVETEGGFGIKEGPKFTVVKIPYKKEGMNMFIIKPKGTQKLRNLEMEWAENPLPIEEAISSADSNVFQRRTKLYLPYFKITDDTIDPIDLVSPMRSIGVKGLFNPEGHGLRILDDTFFVDKMVHRCIVEVDDVGTVLAAATAMTMRASCVKPSIPKIYFDGPFAFQLRLSRAELGLPDAVIGYGRIGDAKALQKV